MSLREDTMTSEAPAGAGIRIKTAVKAATTSEAASAESSVAIEIENVSIAYGDNEAVHDVTMDVPERRVTALIGPSGCGKSTLLRCLNRMNDLIDSARVTGTVRVKGRDIYAPGTDVIDVRRRVGMVFQKSNPFPKSIYENVVYGLRIAGIRDRTRLARSRWSPRSCSWTSPARRSTPSPPSRWRS